MHDQVSLDQDDDEEHVTEPTIPKVDLLLLTAQLQTGWKMKSLRTTMTHPSGRNATIMVMSGTTSHSLRHRPIRRPNKSMRRRLSHDDATPVDRWAETDKIEQLVLMTSGELRSAKDLYDLQIPEQVARLSWPRDLSSLTVVSRSQKCSTSMNCRGLLGRAFFVRLTGRFPNDNAFIGFLTPFIARWLRRRFLTNCWISPCPIRSFPQNPCS